MDNVELDFLTNFLSKLNISPINDEYYTELDKAHANSALIVMIITMVLIFLLC
jgi:hypothetical protein